MEGSMRSKKTKKMIREQIYGSRKKGYYYYVCQLRRYFSIEGESKAEFVDRLQKDVLQNWEHKDFVKDYINKLFNKIEKRRTK